MIIRVDKCLLTFGIRKAATFSIQYFAKLILNNSLVPTFGKYMPFKYLGRYFNFHMDNSDHMPILLDTINNLILKIDCLHCHPKANFSFIHRFVLSKLA